MSRLKSCRAAWAGRRSALGFSLLVLLYTSLPYLLGWAVQGDAFRFTGFVFGVEDGNSYIAKMRSGSSGEWLFRTPYTAAPQEGVVMFLPYLLLGKLASGAGEHASLVILYHIFRVAAGLLAILATDDFLAFFLQDVRLRIFGLALAVLGGGLGWVLVLAGADHWLGSLPLDFYSPEAFGFLGLYGFPHLSLARALILWTLLAYLRSFPEQARGWNFARALKIGLVWLGAGLAQPLALVVIGAAIGFHLAAVGIFCWFGRRRRPGDRSGWLAWKQGFRTALIAGILPGLLLAYQGGAVLVDPYLQAWSAQNIIRSPHPLHYLLAYGLLVPYALAGARRLVTTRPLAGWLPASWCLGLPLLAYAPVNLQRRLPEGAWVALVVLALAALEASPEHPRPKKAVLLRLPLCLAFPSALLLLAGGLAAGARPGLPVFRPVGEAAAFAYLEAQAQPGDVVLAAYETGNALPAWAPVRVVIGHGPESAGLAGLQPHVAGFYQAGTPESERRELLRRFNVRYVFWGPAERALGGWDPAGLAGLVRCYDSGGYTIFEVVD